MNKGSMLKALREGAGISLTKAAEQVGISKQLLYKYEKDIVVNIPDDTIKKLAILYNSSPAYIMGWSPDDTEFSIFENIALSSNYEIFDDDDPEYNYSMKWIKNFNWSNKKPSDTVTVCKRNYKDEITFEKRFTIEEISYVVTLVQGYVLKYIKTGNPAVSTFENITLAEQELISAYRKASPETQAIVNKIFDIKGDTESSTAESIVS